MLESDGRSGRSRRRRLSQAQQAALLRKTHRGGSQLGRSETDRPERAVTPQRAIRPEFNPHLSPSTDTRFNVRYLLFGNGSGRQTGQQPPRRDLPARLHAPRVSDTRAGGTSPSMPEFPVHTPRTGRSPIRFEPTRRNSPTVTRGRSMVRPVPSNTRISDEVTPLRTRRVRSPRSRPIVLPSQLEAAQGSERRTSRPATPLVYAVRLLILAVGVGAIAGTFLSIWNPTLHSDDPTPPTNGPVATQSMGTASSWSRDATPMTLTASPSVLTPSAEMTSLTRTIETLAARNPGLTPGVYLFDLDTGAYLNLNGTSNFSAASMIKVPVLVAFLQDVDAGKIRLDQMLTMQASDIGTGSGDMQYQPPGTRYSALETATKMIVISDNTATNMLINLMGGADALNQRFRSWGLNITTIRNPLPDLEGTNTTTPEELTKLMAAVTQGDLLSLRSRDRLLSIMRQTETRTLLPRGLGDGAIIAHKTGDIGSLVGDVGVIDMPSGKRYIAAVMVQRPTNDDRAQELIREISRASYEYLNQPMMNPGNAAPVNSANPGFVNPAQ